MTTNISVPYLALDDEEAGEVTRPINDGPALLAIRRAARIARERLELAPNLSSAADALESIERLAAEALS